MHGKGRVFCHLDGPPRRRLGKPALPGPLDQRLELTTGRADAKIEPNVTKVTPGYLTHPS